MFASADTTDTSQLTVVADGSADELYESRVLCTCESPVLTLSVPRTLAYYRHTRSSMGNAINFARRRIGLFNLRKNEVESYATFTRTYQKVSIE